MDTVGLRDLRQNASELVRRAEAGEELLVTVSGRPAAVLGPATPSQWRRYDEIAEVFDGPADPAWSADRDLIDHTVRDAWQR